jgi:hypothetical protein
MAVTKKQIIAELSRESAMRRKVWKRQGDYFVNREHQNQYDAIECAIRIFQALTDAEYNRLAAVVNEPTVQKELF